MKSNHIKALLVLLVPLFAILLPGNGFSATYDATGTWSASTSNHWNNCGDPPQEPGTISVTMTQTGDNVTLVRNGITYTGTVSGATYTLSAIYPEEGGTTTETLTATLSSSTSGSGTGSWSWTDGDFSCNGGFDLTLQKLSGAQAYLFYPHVDTNPPWATEIAIINTGGVALNGTLQAYGNNGQLVESMPVNLNALGRREIDVSAEFTNPNAIGYLVLETASTDVCGYTKFYVAGTYRVAVPAVQQVNSGDTYVSHIASDTEWWTGLSVVNTTGSQKIITFQFDDGRNVNRTLAAGEHQAFTVAGLFGGVSQPGIGSAVITNASGIVGVELFGSMPATGNSYLSGILLKDSTTSSIYYPHVDSSAEWWTGIVAYNPGATQTSIAITPYSAAGVQLSGQLLDIPSKGKYIGVVSGLNLPAETAWLEITAANPISGFELFGTTNGNQLAGYTGVGISRTSGVFPKVEQDGWTGIAFVNIGSSTASVMLTAYDDSGAVVATRVMNLPANAKVVNLAENLFSEDISAATYIGFSADSEVVGFQLNGSSDGMMLDGLPGM